MSIFSKIAQGEIPSYKCAENEEFYAFLDINPLAKGHTLCIPRREVDYIFDMEDDEIARFQVFAKKVALSIGKALGIVFTMYFADLLSPAIAILILTLSQYLMIVLQIPIQRILDKRHGTPEQ